MEKNVTRFPSAPQALKQVQSKIVYEIVARPQPSGSSQPHILGEGRFARVFLAWQRSAGRNLRQVAIKILHSHATHNDENLFQQEIDLLKDLSHAGSGHVINLIDLIHLDPMVMCGCGKIYHPLCPNCGKEELQREDQDDKLCAVLVCPDKKCGYEVSGDKIEQQQQYRRLITQPAKRCCTSGPRASEGTIINFVERPALVMELADHVLSESSDQRWDYVQRRCRYHRLPLPAKPVAKAKATQPKDQAHRLEQRLSQFLTLDKILMMLKLSEAVAWLHGKMEVVHKDLTPDNVMVHPRMPPSVEEQGALQGNLMDVMDEISGYPLFAVRLIDFGLADRKKLTRSWYEESYVNRGDVNKKPYFSPEAIDRVHSFRGQIHIDTEARRLVLPAELIEHDLSVMPEDTLAYEWDNNRDHDLRITEVGPVSPSRPEEGFYAIYEGTPPPQQQHRQFQLVRPLCEPHDIFSLGAIFFHILTDDRSHSRVNQLRAFVDTLQANPCGLTTEALLRQHGPTYMMHRDRILYPEVEFRNELMLLILRAMVRGCPQSFCTTRVERNRESAQRVLEEVRRIYHAIQREVIAAPRVMELRRMAAAAAVAVLLGGIGTGLVVGYEWASRGGRASVAKEQKEPAGRPPA